MYNNDNHYHTLKTKYLSIVAGSITCGDASGQHPRQRASRSNSSMRETLKTALLRLPTCDPRITSLELYAFVSGV